MSAYNKVRSAATGIALAMLVSCGGGGGGGGGGTPPLQYSGNTSAATITTTNAGTLTANVTGGGSGLDAATSAVGGSQVQVGQGQIDIGRRLVRGVRATVKHSGSSSALTSVPIDETVPCPNGGTVRVFGDVSPNGLGTVTVVYTNCGIGTEIFSGQGTMRVDGFDLFTNTVTDSTLTFPRLSVRGSANTDIGGSLRVQTNLPANTETVTENIVALDLNTSRMTKSEDLVIIDVFNDIFFPSSYNESVSGRVYDSVLGYVDLFTNTPLSFPMLTQEFPSSGEIVITGASNARLRVTAVTSSLAALALDLNNDGTFEIQARVQFTALRGPAAADIADSDADGMHNSWEIAFNVSDPNADPDFDGFNNLAEYQAGSNPNIPDTGLPPPPAPGPLPPGTATGRQVVLANNSDIVYHSATDRIYAAVKGNPGSVVPINPATGAQDSPIPVGADPVKLVLSEDGQYLYVVLGGEPAVQRINLAPPQTLELTIALGSDPFFGITWHAEDVAVLPGAPESIAVSLMSKGASPRHQGVAIYDNATRRPNKTPSHTGSNVIEFSANATTLYGYNNETTEFGFRRMAVDANGVTVSDVYDSFAPGGPLVTGGFGVDIKFAGGFIFTTSGQMIDPVARVQVRTFSLPAPFGNALAVDTTLRRVFYLRRDGSDPTIHAFNMDNGTLFGSANIVGASGMHGSLIRWGAKGLAFRTDAGQIFIVESSNWIP